MARLSLRGKECITCPPEYLALSFAAWHDEYDAEHNQDGFINLAIAENLLSLSTVSSRLLSAPPIPPKNLTYGSPGPFNETIAKFLSSYITAHPVSPDHVVVLNGATAVIEALATVLCDPGDKVLTTGPGYRGLEQDVTARAGARIVVASLDESSEANPVMTVSALDKSWTDAGGIDSGIRMAIICSPNNPTGEVLSSDCLVDIVRWGRSKGIHMVFDEIYAKSVHSEGVRFCSVSEALDGHLGADVHIVWSFSKDFCLSGTRVGVLYSQNRELLDAINAFIAHFMSTSRHTQWALQDMLRDDVWLSHYFRANQRNLRSAYARVTALLDKLAVPYLPASAGFFVWVDLRRWMLGDSQSDEMKLWRQICECKVLLTPASQCFGSRYGHFRLCFAAVDTATLQVALDRMKTVLSDHRFID